MKHKELMSEVISKIDCTCNKSVIATDIVNYLACHVGTTNRDALKRMDAIIIAKEYLQWLDKTVYSVMMKIDSRWVTGYYNADDLKRGQCHNLSWTYK